MSNVGLCLPDATRKNGIATMKKTITSAGRTVEGSPLLPSQPPEVCRWIDHQVDARIMVQAKARESRPANIAFFVDDTRTIRGYSSIIGESYYQRTLPVTGSKYSVRIG